MPYPYYGGSGGYGGGFWEGPQGPYGEEDFDFQQQYQQPPAPAPNFGGTWGSTLAKLAGGTLITVGDQWGGAGSWDLPGMGPPMTGPGMSGIPDDTLISPWRGQQPGLPGFNPTQRPGGEPFAPGVGPLNRGEFGFDEFQAGPRFQPTPGFGYDRFEGMEPFTAPTAEDVRNLPGYAFREEQGAKRLEQSAAAKGLLRSSGTMKDLIRYGQDFASNEYGQEYARQASEYDRAYGHARGEQALNYEQSLRANELAYGRGLGEYRLGYGERIGEQQLRYGQARDIYGLGNEQARYQNQQAYGRGADEWARRYGVETDRYGREIDEYMGSYIMDTSEKERISRMVQQRQEQVLV